MGVDPLDDVLRMVAEGRLTAEEAAPIVAALEDRAADGAPGASGRPGESSSAAGTGPGDGPAADPAAGPSLRVEVREAGRRVVNLRLPVAIGRYALDRIPGLSGDQVDSVREALRTGRKGPILEVDDGTSSVVIVVD